MYGDWYGQFRLEWGLNQTYGIGLYLLSFSFIFLIKHVSNTQIRNERPDKSFINITNSTLKYYLPCP